ncbi:MAG: hypothetical protein ACJ786_14640 [Catenulispora sp.]
MSTTSTSTSPDFSMSTSAAGSAATTISTGGASASPVSASSAIRRICASTSISIAGSDTDSRWVHPWTEYSGK